MAELTPLVEAWIRYAEDDWQDSLILASAGRNGRSICFHVQQCIEKLFKAELMRMALPDHQSRGASEGTELGGVEPGALQHHRELVGGAPALWFFLG